MRRDYFSVEIRNADRGGAGEDGESTEPRRPTLDVAFDGPEAALDDRLADTREDLPVPTLDIACRLLGPVDGPADGPADGVIGVTDRQTGDFLLEANVDGESVLEFVRAAREYGKDTDGTDRYRVRVTREGSEVLEQDKSTFLVYSDEGNLVRRHSLIPSGVEL
jgi:hypothetical protein